MAAAEEFGDSNEHLSSFEASRLAAGENVLAWVLNSRCQGEPGEGVAVLTDRRLCFHRASFLEDTRREVPVLGEILRYAPVVDGDCVHAMFETHGGTLGFVVEGEAGLASLGTLLGTLQALREAKARMERSGLDPTYVSPPREGAAEGVSAIYQLIRLRDLFNRGVFGEMDFALERTMMIQRFVEEGAPKMPG